MKTFSDYILEKQNFIFGGKSSLTGKEYGGGKIFSDLKEGDTIYEYRFEDILKPNYKLDKYAWEIWEMEKIDTFHTKFSCERVVDGEYRYFSVYVQNDDMDEPITMYESKDRTSRIWHKYHVAITTYEADVERIRQTLIETFLKR